jgi:putative SOS response-associated peptidase YedK
MRRKIFWAVSVRTLGLGRGLNTTMCFSALVRQDLQWLVKRYGAEIAWEMFEELFRQRLDDPEIQCSRALDVYILRMQDERARSSQTYIERYRAQQAHVWEQELFKQRKRLMDAQRKLQTKETKAARNEERIATGKVATLTEKLTGLRSDQIVPIDARLFPKKYVPVIVGEGDRLLIRPMRYLCRLPGKPSSYDQKFDGTYNARRDNLNGFWSGLYGKHHGIMVIDSFFENVPRHLYERRELAAGERETNVVLHFNPNSGEPMTVACLWSHWTGAGEPELDSFAAITDVPPPEVLATGHTRCVISLKEGNVREWLAPARVGKGRLEEILSDRAAPVYEHRIEERIAA